MLPAGHSPLRLERRAKPRVLVPFQATVQGVDQEGAPFEAATVVDNLSAGGLYLRIGWEVREGARLLVNVHMNGQSTAPSDPGLSFEVYGYVKRVEPIPGGAFGVAVAFSSSVFM
jgi:hypothetical protein